MSDVKQETRADIIAEMRMGSPIGPCAYRIGIPDKVEVYESGAKRRIMMIKNVTVQELADRFEAAGKREKAKPGNAAAMREALIEIEKMAHCDLTNVYPKYRNKFNNLVGGIERIARAALSEPARQCDVGTAEEQGERCMAQFDQWRCKGDGKKLITAIMDWAQTPYEAQEGGAE